MGGVTYTDFLEVGPAKELLFPKKLAPSGELQILVSVYDGEVERVPMTRVQAIELIDHLVLVFEIEEWNEA